MNYNLRETKKLLNEINEKKFITENEILRLKHFYKNAKYNKDYDYLEFFNNLRLFNKLIKLTDEQILKGRKYIFKKYLNRFGYRRNNKLIKFNPDVLFIIEQADKLNTNFYFAGFVVISNGIMDFIEPIYLFETYQKNTKYYKSFRYFHYGESDYEFIFEKDKNLKDDNIIYIKDFI